jgi:hypothetical protein
VQSRGVGAAQPDDRLDGPDRKRDAKGLRAMAPPQVGGGGEHRLDECPHAREVALTVQHDDGDDRAHERNSDQQGGEREVVRGQRARAQRDREHGVQREQHRHVEHALGDQRPDHRPRRRSGTRGHVEHAHRVTRSRRQHVVAHVAHARQRVAVDARGHSAVEAKQQPPALGADQRRHRVERDRERHETRMHGRLRRRLPRRPHDDAGERSDRNEPAGGPQAPVIHQAGCAAAKRGTAAAP